MEKKELVAWKYAGQLTTDTANRTEDSKMLTYMSPSAALSLVTLH